MMTIQQTPEMLDVARRVVWFKEPEETLRDPAHRETVVPLCINNVTLLIGAILLFMANGLVAHSQATPDQLAQGNLIPNGSFETGMAAGWGVSVRDGGFHDLPAAVDRSTAYAGKASLKVNIPPGAGTEMEISSPPVDITVPGTYTATIALKAANGPVGITVSLDNTGVCDWERLATCFSNGPRRQWANTAAGEEQAIWLAERHCRMGRRRRTQLPLVSYHSLCGGQPGRAESDDGTAGTRLFRQIARRVSA
jgi:hypothetical protein